MSKTMTFGSFQELAAYLGQQPNTHISEGEAPVTAPDANAAAEMHQIGEVGHADVPDGRAGAADSHPTDQPQGTPSAGAGEPDLDDLAALLARLESAGLTLSRVVRQDEEARAQALRELERHDALLAAAQEAEEACRRAGRVRAEAEAVAEAAFSEETRAAAREVLALATDAAATAERTAAERRAEVQALAGRLDVERLLAERRRQEEAEKARAAAAERAERLSGALSRAREALEAGRLEEAKDLLGTVASLDPESSAVCSLKHIIAQREFAVKVTAAEEALWAARRELRHRHAEAIARLEALDVDGLPDDLAGEVFGEWARAWSKQCRAVGIEEPLRFAPDPGRGAVLARDTTGEPDAPYKVLGAIGMGPRWRAGSPVAAAQVRRARPLR